MIKSIREKHYTFLAAPDDFTSVGGVTVTLSYNINTNFTLSPAMVSVNINDDNIPEQKEELSLSLTRLFSFPDIVIRAPNVSRLIIQDNGKH